MTTELMMTELKEQELETVAGGAYSLEDVVNAFSDAFGTITNAVGNAFEVVADAAGTVVDIVEHVASQK